MTDVAARPRTATLPGAPLQVAPAVNRCLTDAGLAELSPEGLQSPAGRNSAWSGRTVTGRPVFVKQLRGVPEDCDNRMRRVLAFERFADAVFAPGRRPAPRVLASDLTSRVLVFDQVQDATSGAQLVVDEEIGTGHCAEIGRLVGAVHAADAAACAGLDPSPFPLPSLAALQALPAGWFEALSFGEIQAWRLFQGDPALMEALERLLLAEERAPRVPTHGDFRMDQLLFTHRVLLVDWEEFRLGDGARDVGAFVGEWIYRSVLDIITTRGGQTPFVPGQTHDDVIARGVASLQRVTPLISAFWQGYLDVRGDVDSEFRMRAVGFAGWHTLDRLLAGGTRRARLSAIERAAAGIGRTALVDPTRFHLVLGLE